MADGKRDRYRRAETIKHQKHQRYLVGLEAARDAPSGPPATTRFRVCTKCGCTKPATLDFFSERTETRRGEVRVDFRADCRVCRSLKGKQSRDDRAEELADRRRRRHREKGDLIREQARRRYHEDVEASREKARQSRERNRETQLERNRQRRRENPEVHKAARLRYRARLANAEGTHTSADLLRIFEEQNGYCYYCARSFKVVEPTVDHKQPLSKNGSNWSSNLAWACQPCNDSKQDKTEAEFWAYLGRIGRMPQIRARRKRNAEQDGGAA